jgi:hypothetical protein
MIRALLKYLLRIANYDRIPRLPKGMLATKYDAVPDDARRVMARLGIRDVVGLKVRLKRAKVEHVDDLVAQLEHFQPERKLQRRLSVAIGRVLHASDFPPHRAEIVADARRQNRNVEIDARLKRVIQEGKQE